MPQFSCFFFFLAFLAFLVAFCVKKFEKAYFDQCLECAAPNRWLQYTTQTSTQNYQPGQDLLWLLKNMNFHFKSRSPNKMTLKQTYNKSQKDIQKTGLRPGTHYLTCKLPEMLISKIVTSLLNVPKQNGYQKTYKI